jgi:hypothetical protein
MTGHRGRRGSSPALGCGVDGSSEGGVVVRVDLFVDPACMWSWLTSRWLVEVAPQRGLQVSWRSYSLLLRDGPEGLEDRKAALWGASHRAVRVMQALHADDPDRPAASTRRSSPRAWRPTTPAGRHSRICRARWRPPGWRRPTRPPPMTPPGTSRFDGRWPRRSPSSGRESAHQRWCCTWTRRWVCMGRWSRRRRPGPTRCDSGTRQWPSPPCRACSSYRVPGHAGPRSRGCGHSRVRAGSGRTRAMNPTILLAPAVTPQTIAHHAIRDLLRAPAPPPLGAS